MSQTGSYSSAAPAPPGTVTALQGNTGGPVGPNGSGIINVVGTGNLTVTGNPGTFTETISQNNFVSGTTTTVGAVTGNVITFPLGATPGVYTVDTIIAGFSTAGGTLGTGYAIVGAVRTDGAIGTITGQAPDHFEEGALSAGTAALVVSGNNLIVQVTGTAGFTIDWAAQLTYVFVS